MSSSEDSLAAALRSDRPHSARVWNYLLGGHDNYPADRETGETILRVFPGFAALARVQRRFLARAVEFLVREAGVRQFLDVGSGLPTADNTHQLAQRIAPESRVVYVDNDPLVLLHAEALLASTPEGACSYADADLRDPDRILAEAARTLDLDRPVGLTMLGLLGQFADSEDPQARVDALMAGLPSGSWLALSDGTDTGPELVAAVEGYNSRSVHTYHLRSPERIARFFHGLEIAEPGVVRSVDWRPDPSGPAPAPGDFHSAGGVGRKP